MDHKPIIIQKEKKIDYLRKHTSKCNCHLILLGEINSNMTEYRNVK